MRVLAWGEGEAKEEDKLREQSSLVFPPHTHCTPRVSCCISVLCLCVCVPSALNEADQASKQRLRPPQPRSSLPPPCPLVFTAFQYLYPQPTIHQNKCDMPISQKLRLVLALNGGCFVFGASHAHSYLVLVFRVAGPHRPRPSLPTLHYPQAAQEAASQAARSRRLCQGSNRSSSRSGRIRSSHGA